MNINAINNCNFKGFHCIQKEGIRPNKEQIRLKRLIEDTFNDDLHPDYNMLEKLENIGGADIIVTIDDGILSFKAQKINPLPKLKSLEKKFYKKANKTLVPTEDNALINNRTIENFYKLCKEFVNKVTESGDYIG